MKRPNRRKFRTTTRGSILHRCVMRTVISHPAVTAWRNAQGALRISLKLTARKPQTASVL